MYTSVSCVVVGTKQNKMKNKKILMIYIFDTYNYK